MGALIDTSVFVAAERGRFDLGAWLRLHPNEAFSIGAITASELLHGGSPRSDRPAPGRPATLDRKSVV